MSYFDVTLPLENAWNFVDQIGYSNILHFMDSNLNVPFASRQFSHNILVCNGMEERLNLIEKQIIQFNKPISYSENSSLVLSEVRKKIRERELKEHKAAHTLFEEFDEFI